MPTSSRSVHLLSACEGGSADTRSVVVKPFNTRTQPFHPRKPFATDVCTAVCPVRHTMETIQKCTSSFRPNHVKPKKSRHNADHLLAIHTVFVHSGGATTFKARGANAVGSALCTHWSPGDMAVPPDDVTLTHKFLQMSA